MKKFGQDTQCCSWHKKIQDVSFRFELLKDFDDEAVLDKETCRVWERRPSAETKPWPNARLSCAQKSVGGRGGWRLPSFYELASLVDPTVTTAGNPRLPAGHPFLDVQASEYCSSTVFAEGSGFTMAVRFNFVAGSDAPIFVTDANIAGAPKLAWAVRRGLPGPSAY